MKLKEEVFIIIKGTVLSILVFFSVSFLTLFNQTAPFSIIGERLDLQIGFPFVYLHIFQLECSFQGSWGPLNALINCFIFWVLTTGIYVMVKRKK